MEPFTKVTGVDTYIKVTGQKFPELTKPHNGCCHKPPDLHWPVLRPHIRQNTHPITPL